MIGYLQGRVLENLAGRLLVGVGSYFEGAKASMVGYAVSVPQGAQYGKLLAGETVELFIYPHIREDSFDLYGFCSRMEKELFLTLLTVNGIGPKSALTILSSVSFDALVESIIRADQKFLNQIPGIGKKTAERLIVELRDSVRKKMEAGIFSKEKSTGRSSAHPYSGVNENFSSSQDFLHSTVFQDAQSALISLGYREGDVSLLLRRVIEEAPSQTFRAEDLVKTALRQLV